MTFIYLQKADAPTSYYLQEGRAGFLPNRICITKYQFAQTSRAGQLSTVGQFKATFKKNEESKYKNEKGTLHSNIYSYPATTKGIIGAGDLRNTNDLLIFQDLSGGDWKKIAIHLYPNQKFLAYERIKALMMK